MATEKPRFTITLDDETYQKVLDFKGENSISTQSKTIQQLVKLGLLSAAAETDEKAEALKKIAALLSPDDLSVVTATAKALIDRQESKDE